MKTFTRVLFVLTASLCTIGFGSGLYADETSEKKEQSEATQEQSISASHSLTDQQRWGIKRQVMSVPGVLLDMSNMTDNGYAWNNDVLWEGETLPANEKWYTAGFFFKRTGYKGVWLQYTFQIDQTTNRLQGFKRSFGTQAFR